jgi:hypothetical protein
LENSFVIFSGSYLFTNSVLNHATPMFVKEVKPNINLVIIK